MSMRLAVIIMVVGLIILSIHAIKYTRNYSYELLPGIEISQYRIYAYEYTIYQLASQLESQVQDLIERQPRRIKRQIVLDDNQLLYLLPYLIDLTIEYENLTETHQTFSIRGSVAKDDFLEKLITLPKDKKELIVDHRRNMNDALQEIYDLVRNFTNLESLDTLRSVEELRYKLSLVNSQHWLFQGELALWNEEWTQAINYYSLALSFNPQSVPIYRKLYQTYLAQNNRIYALSALEKILEIAPDDIEALYRLGKHWESQGSRDQAVKYYARLLEHTTEYPELNYYIALYYYELENFANATLYAKQAAASSSIHIDTAKGLVRLLLELNHLSETEQLLQLLLLKEPRNADLYQSLGDISYEKADFRQALIFYQQAVKLNSNDYHTLFNLANSHFGLGNFQDAVSYYQKALRLDANDRICHFNLGNALFKTENFQEAADHYNRAISLGLVSPEIFFNLGNSYYQLKEYDVSINYHQRALELRPDYVEALFNIAHTYEVLDEIDTALTHYRKVIQLEPEYYKAYYNIANYHKNLGELETAISYYQRSLAIHEDDDFAYSNMGDCYRMLGFYAEAENAYKRAIEINPENPIPYNNLSLTFYLQENYLKSLEYLRKAAKLGHYNASRILENFSLD